MAGPPTWAKRLVVQALNEHADRRDYATTRTRLLADTNLADHRLRQVLNHLQRTGVVYSFTRHGSAEPHYWLDERRQPLQPVRRYVKPPPAAELEPQEVVTVADELPPWMPF